MDLTFWIKDHAAENPDKAAIIFDGIAISYATLATDIANDIQLLSNKLSVNPGDRVAFLGFNSPRMISLLFACARIGAILLPLNWRLAVPEHSQLLNHAKPLVLFYEQSFEEHINKLKDDIPTIALVDISEVTSDWTSVDVVPKNSTSLSNVETLDNAKENGLLLCYTSGTTGTPKGALLSKKALEFNALNSIDMNGFTEEDTVLTVLPMFHVGGLNIQTIPALCAGATVVLHSRFELDSFFNAFDLYPITTTLIVPTILHSIMADARWVSLKHEHLKMIAIGSSVVSEELVISVCDWGVPLIQVYGATETCPIAAYTAIDNAARKPASTGKTALHCEIQLVNEKGEEVKQGNKGEILVRGPNVLLTYWNDPASTKASFTNQWFHTGDVGHFDDDGFLYVDGRIKEMIICGGENLYPAAIENLLSQWEVVEEVAVTGKADDYWGEICVAVIAPKSGVPETTVDIEKLQNYCTDKIARSSIPREIYIVKELPRNAMGKVVKEALQELININVKD